MSRFVHAISFLLLLAGLLATSGTPMDLCLCENGHIVVNKGCPAGCCDIAADGGNHTGAPALAAFRGDRNGECPCVPLSLATTPARASVSTKPLLSSKTTCCGMPLADAPINHIYGSMPLGVSLAYQVPMRTSPSLLVQRTIVLRI
jgi:hypothetical protein